MTAAEHDKRFEDWRIRALLVGLLALVSWIASAPGLGGAWVHDDLNMVDNASYDGFDDVLAVFQRGSAHYARHASDAQKASASTQTYRPITELTLVATHTLMPSARVHHLVGWLFHLLASGLFGLVLMQSDRRAQARPAQLFLGALFLLHPVGVESYVWINGRSDVVAGLWLALLLLILGHPRSRSLLGALLVFVVALFGCASKETFVPAALLVSVASWFSSIRDEQDLTHPPHTKLASIARRACYSLVPTLLAVAVHLLLWFSVLPSRADSLGQARSPLLDPAVWRFVPKLTAIVSYALLSLRAANMQSLSWDMVRALSAGEWASGLLALLGVVALVWRRDWRGLLLIAAAAGCIVPTLAVTSVVWLGLDRYLYMPLMLLLLAMSPYLVHASVALRAQAPQLVPRLLPLLAAVVLSVAAVDTFIASRAYADQRMWLATLLEERPDDPTVFVLLANELGQPGAGPLLQRLPPPPWPSSVIAPLISHALASKQFALARRVAEYAVSHYPDNSLNLALAFKVRYLTGQTEAALSLLPRLTRDNALCPEVKKQLELWAVHASEPRRARLVRALAEVSCASAIGSQHAVAEGSAHAERGATGHEVQR